MKKSAFTRKKTQKKREKRKEEAEGLGQHKRLDFTCGGHDAALIGVGVRHGVGAQDIVAVRVPDIALVTALGRGLELVQAVSLE